MKKLKYCLGFLLVLNIVFLAGCQNTVSGFGRDMQKNGQEIQKSADHS